MVAPDASCGDPCLGGGGHIVGICRRRSRDSGGRDDRHQPAAGAARGGPGPLRRRARTSAPAPLPLPRAFSIARSMTPTPPLSAATTCSAPENSDGCTPGRPTWPTGCTGCPTAQSSAAGSCCAGPRHAQGRDSRQRFLQAADRGLPIFSDGLRLLIDGLKVVSRDRHDDSEVAAAITRMGNYAAVTDWSRTSSPSQATIPARRPLIRSRPQDPARRGH